ncbi:MAG: division/cell wall cluster transcriptional repressor MraZ [Firmicutes bacterium]|nr:division/cell wall cluster transcriptional repressor MraZ [Bacillota bacterium]
MLIGEYQNQIDAKNRMIVPSKLRDDLGYKCIITKGLDDCLIIYPMQTWAKQEEALAELPNTDPVARAFRRYLYQNASECEVDKQGRVLLPAVLREKAKIEKDLITIGVVDRIEIWAKEVYETSENGAKLSEDSFKDLSDKYLV